MTMWVMSGIASTYCTTGQRSRQAPLYDINSHLAYGRGTLGAQPLDENRQPATPPSSPRPTPTGLGCPDRTPVGEATHSPLIHARSWSSVDRAAMATTVSLSR